MKDIIFIIGGCRSGKSKYALKMAEELSEDKKVFIATCVPHDDEMKQRIAQHQKERSHSWNTIEEPVQLPEIIAERGKQANVILVDCLTLWITNLWLEANSQKKLEDHVSQLVHVLKEAHCPVVLVSNEVGTGIVPENKLARQFRDSMGWVNQAIAGCSNKVIWMVAGIPVTIKG